MTDFGYGTGGLTTVRDPLAADAVAAVQASDNDSSNTVIAYTAGGLVERVTLPSAAAGPAHSYNYDTGQTTVQLVGVTGPAEPAAYYRLATYDAAGRSRINYDATEVRVSEPPGTRSMTDP